MGLLQPQCYRPEPADKRGACEGHTQGRKSGKPTFAHSGKSDVINTAKTGAYKYAESQMPGKIRPRFNERPKESAARTTLKQQYLQLREFMTMKSSTVTGVRAIRDARYQTAVQRGFKGTQEQWDMAVQKFFTKAAEKLFDSDKIYDAITGNNSDVLEDIITADRDDQMTKGQALLDYIRRIT